MMAKSAQNRQFSSKNYYHPTGSRLVVGGSNFGSNWYYLPKTVIGTPSIPVEVSSPP
jgi:hypothetical protein